MGGDVDTIKALVESGAKLDAQQRYGDDTPLHVALRASNCDAAMTLVQLGADPNIENTWRKNALTMAKDCGKRFELMFADTCRRMAAARSSSSSSNTHAKHTAAADLPAAPVIPKYVSAAERAEAEKADVPPPPDIDETDIEYAKKFGLDDDDVNNDVTTPNTTTNAPPPSTSTTTTTTTTTTDNNNNNNGGDDVPALRPVMNKESFYGHLKDQQKMFASSEETSTTTTAVTAATTATAKTGEVKKSGGVGGAASASSAAAKERAKQNAMRRMTKEQADRVRLLKRRIQRLEMINKSLAIWPTKLPQHGQGQNGAGSTTTAAEARRQKKEAAAAEYKAMKAAAEEKERAVAVLMIKHLLGWFDPKIPPVTLAEWTPHTDIHRKLGSSAGGGGDISGNGTPGGLFTTWCRANVEVFVESQDLSAQLIINNCRSKIRGFASIVTDFDKANDTYIKELGDRYPLVKEEAKYLKARVFEIIQACNGVGTHGSDTSQLLKAIITGVGSTYWVFNSLHTFTLDAMVSETRSFVGSLLALGTKPDSEIETAVSCLRLANVVNGITFYEKDPTVAKDIAESLNTLQATARTLIMGVFQGGDRNTEYSTIIGTHLGQIKTLVSNNISSRCKSQIASRVEGDIAEKAAKYFIAAIKYYKPFTNQSTMRDLLNALSPIPVRLIAFLKQYLIARDTTVREWSPFLKAGLDLTDEIDKFRATFLSPEFDPDGLFKTCADATEQCLHQFLIAIYACALGNRNCPRHEVACSVRATCFTLVSVMDICYLNSN